MRGIQDLQQKIGELRKQYTIIERAYWYAVICHRGQKRKDGSAYILHPVEVAETVSGMSDAPSVIAAALLHDVIEDSNASLNDIAKNFGVYVADLVDCETEKEYPGEDPEASWQKRKEGAIAKIAAAGREAKMISLADKLANLRSIERMKKTLGEEVWNQFHMKDKSRQAWYYRSMRDQYLGLKKTDAWKEYSSLIRDLFGSERAEFPVKSHPAQPSTTIDP